MTSQLTPRERLDGLMRSRDNGAISDVDIEIVFLKLLVDASDEEADALVTELPPSHRNFFINLVTRLTQEDRPGYRIRYLQTNDPRTNEQREADEERMTLCLVRRAARLLEIMSTDGEYEI